MGVGVGRRWVNAGQLSLPSSFIFNL
jgi:hypothetical protein